MPPNDPHDPLRLSAVELNLLGQMADAAEATAKDVHELRVEWAAHHAREEAALSGVEAFLRRMQEREGERIGEAAAGRATLWRILAQPWVAPIVTALALGWAVSTGLIAPPPAIVYPVPGASP